MKHEAVITIKNFIINVRRNLHPSGLKNKNSSNMDTSEVIKIAHQYADAIKRNHDFYRVILLGSYVRGNFREDSDIDIAVVFKDYSSTLDTQLELMRLRRKIDSRIEPHPFRESEFNASNPIAYEIIQHGQLIEESTGASFTPYANLFPQLNF